MDSLQFLKTIPTKNISIFIDEKANLELGDITAKEFEDFSHLPNYQNRKVGTSYWFKIDFNNPATSNQSFWLGIQADYVYSYLVHASGKVDSAQAGMMLPYQEKTSQIIQKREVNLLPIHIKAGETAHLYLRNQFTGLLLNPSKVDYFHSLDAIRLNILENEKTNTFINGFFQAILLIMFLYCLFFFHLCKRSISPLPCDILLD